MNQFSFAGTWEDSWDILQEILRAGDVTLIPDMNYDRPTPLCFTALDDAVKKILRDRRNLYLWGRAYSLFPPHLERIEEGQAAGKYYVSLSRQGPGLELTLPPCYQEGGILHVGPGTLSGTPHTFNPETGIWEAPSAALRAGFSSIKARMKRHLVKFNKPPQIWIGKDALMRVKKKDARITGFER
ncbi:MAG TPA: hypothetical protein VK395_11250 [Gemmataceae bacterium]|nr:hypothetical protein [Gemmataceae bacterium]